MQGFSIGRQLLPPILDMHVDAECYNAISHAIIVDTAMKCKVNPGEVCLEPSRGL